MAISADEVRAIARLARIEIDEAETPAFQEQLSGILEFVAQLNSLDTNDVEPMAHPQEIAARLREDVVTEVDDRQNFQQIAPSVENGLYLVPKVIE
jgi:aspartyl-tRNA(Asn)/glutamyl-tRNA(Gln) amidotransferase subunit C